MRKRSIVQLRNSLTLRKYSLISAIVLGVAILLSSGKEAAALTADEVLNRMNADQQVGYLAGLVDGLAYARWLTDKPNDVGMQCIYNWFYNEKTETLREINTWFERHLDKPVDALLYILIKKECGE